MCKDVQVGGICICILLLEMMISSLSSYRLSVIVSRVGITFSLNSILKSCVTFFKLSPEPLLHGCCGFDVGSRTFHAPGQEASKQIPLGGVCFKFYMSDSSCWV